MFEYHIICLKSNKKVNKCHKYIINIPHFTIYRNKLLAKYLAFDVQNYMMVNHNNKKYCPYK